MKTTVLKLFTIGSLIIAKSSFLLQAQTVSTVETLTLSPASYWNGSSAPLGTTFNSGNAIFQNYYDTSYGGYWSGGWAYSNSKDSTTVGSEYSARTAIGYNNSDNYLIGQNDAVINLNPTAIGKGMNGFYLTNSTYAAISMRDGDAFAKKFGGASGNDPDWFKLTVRKWLNGVMTDDSVEFYLADFRPSDNAQDYIVTTWQWVDLTSLGNVDSLKFILSSSDANSYGIKTPAFFCVDNFTTADVPLNQFAPPVGQAGTTAIHKDSSVFVAWATGCHVTRGYQDISNTSLGYASAGDSSMALDVAGSNGVVSLGDGGEAIVTFADPIKNGDGPDFAVFENAFNDTFLELAFVEVSSDGTHFYRFKATSNTQDTIQINNAGAVDATQINNLAGKYRALYGTPFDLQELANTDGLDVNHVTQVKIIDVVGCIQNTYARHDKNGNKINDPWSTAFTSSGFDLDAVGLIHVATTDTTTDTTTGIAATSSVFNFNVYPNPAKEVAYIQLNSTFTGSVKITIADYTGKEIRTVLLAEGNAQQAISLNLSELTSGIYFVSVLTEKGVTTKKLMVAND